jgi:hypothetical protein
VVRSGVASPSTLTQPAQYGRHLGASGGRPRPRHRHRGGARAVRSSRAPLSIRVRARPS